MARSSLVPLRRALLRVIGGSMAFAMAIAALAGACHHTCAINVRVTVPEILWDGSLSLRLQIGRSRPLPILAGVRSVESEVSVGRAPNPGAGEFCLHPPVDQPDPNRGRRAWITSGRYAAGVARSISVPARIVFAMSLDSSRYQVPLSNSMAG